MIQFFLLVTFVQLLVTDSGVLSDVRHVANDVLPKDMWLTVPELIRYWGYPVEVHEVPTDDGYYLTLHRIPHGRKKSKDSEDAEKSVKPVMFLQHGLLLDSSIFVSNLPHQSLAYILADAGYDVWMGNNRGNTQSKKHMFRPLNSSAFWDFCWDEMAKYDLPAMIDYVLENTGQPQLYYVGYSQGTMIAFAGLSESISLQKKIKKFFAIAPVTRLTNITPFLKEVAHYEPIIEWIQRKYNIHQFLPHNQVTEFLAEVVCPLKPYFCERFMMTMFGGEEKNVNKTRIPLYLWHFPAGTSVKNMYHYAQAAVSNDFKKYDYGWLENLVWYGSFHAPSYDLRKIHVPTVLISGTKDPLADPVDVKWISEHLPNLVESIVIEGYGHADFLLGIYDWKLDQKIINMTRYE